ncbi:hypothetical protein FWK35_00021812 [Aphis craccivora]|uniref:Uncharacterized protein n=1 Tax=Aphis craccivora TaxID=307492 RepID=A0A6G0YFR0_APHCR|nr:hypothetical protein FWK35_00021812 [Aphis craccivora]
MILVLLYFLLHRLPLLMVIVNHYMDHLHTLNYN